MATLTLTIPQYTATASSTYGGYAVSLKGSCAITATRTAGKTYVDVTAKWTVNSPGGLSYTPVKCYLTVGSTSKTVTIGSSSSSPSLSAGKDYTSSTSFTVSVGDSAGTLTCKAYTVIDSSQLTSSKTSSTVSGTISYDSRGNSLLASVPDIVLGTTGTLSVTKYVSSYTTSITAALNGHTGTVCDKASGTSIEWTPSIEEWAPYITDGASAVATYTLKTYDGSTQIGSDSTLSGYLIVPDTVTPSAGAVTVTDISSHSFGELWVRGLSIPQATISGAEGIYGSTIVSYEYELGGAYASGTEPTVTAASPVSTYGELTGAATVIDSRGYSGTVTNTVSVVNYYMPQIYISLDTADKVTHLKVMYTWYVAPVENRNTKSLVLTFSDGETGEEVKSAEIELTSYSGTGTYETELRDIILRDYTVTATLTDTVQSVSVSESYGRATLTAAAKGESLNVYLADRQLEILGIASTHMPDAWRIIDDSKLEDVDSGIATFECKVAYDARNRVEIQKAMAVGNYLLRGSGSAELYTIIDLEQDTLAQTIYVYAEEAGLDMLNAIALPYTAEEAHPIEWYIEYFAAGTGFEIGTNDIPTKSRTLSWDGEATVTDRIDSVATQFDNAEISYSFAIEGMKITHKYINIHETRGDNTGVTLRLNHEIKRIVTKSTIADLCTALYVTGGTPEGEEDAITLAGYEYDDGDYYVTEDGILASRTALQEWSRYVWEEEPNRTDLTGHIVATYSYDTDSQSELCNRAISELSVLREPEVNYTVDIITLPSGVEVGDVIRIVDEEGELYLAARVLQLKVSVAKASITATLGDYLMLEQGMTAVRKELQDLAARVGVLSSGGRTSFGSEVGKIVSAEGGAESISSGTSYTLCSVPLTSGTWTIQGSAQISGSGTAYMQLSTASSVDTASAEGLTIADISSSTTSMEASLSVSISANAVYRLLLQTTATATVVSSYISAVKIK